jgi:hypothetical protein
VAIVKIQIELPDRAAEFSREVPDVLGNNPEVEVALTQVHREASTWLDLLHNRTSGKDKP